MVVFGVSFTIAGLIFLFGLEPLFKFINWEAALVKLPDSPVPDGNRWFFQALANGLMVIITYMSFAIAVNPWENLNYLPVITLSKVASSLTGLTFFLTTRCMSPVCIFRGGLEGTPYFSSLVVFTSDFPLAIIGFILYRMALKYRDAAE
jgi:hypothetical protein